MSYSWDHKRNDNKLPFDYYCAKSGGGLHYLTLSDLKSFSDAVKKRHSVILKKCTECAIRIGLAVVLNDVDDVTEYEHLDNLASNYV